MFDIARAPAGAEIAYAFRHAFLRDAAYQLQMPRDRARLHALAFQALETLAGGRPPAPPPPREPLPRHPAAPFAAELADHAARSGTNEAALTIYLRHAAEHAERFVQGETSAKLWRALAARMEGNDRVEARRRGAVALMQAGFPLLAEEEMESALGEAAGTDGEADLLAGLAGLACDTGRMVDALDLLDRALGRYLSSGNSAGESNARRIKGTALRLLGRLDASEQELTRAFDLAHRRGDSAAEALNLVTLALVLASTGRPADAGSHFERALTTVRSICHPRLEGIVLGNYGAFLGQQGRTEECEKALLAAIAHHREVGDRRFLGVSLSNLGALRNQGGNVEEARKLFEEALTIHRETGNRRAEGLVLGSLAGLRVTAGAFEEGEKMLRTVLEIHKETGDPSLVSHGLCALAFCLLTSGRASAAEPLFREALALGESLRDPGRRGVQECGLACALHELGHGAEADRFWRSGELLLGAHGSPAERAHLESRRLQAIERTGRPLPGPGDGAATDSRGRRVAQAQKPGSRRPR